ncbi:MAG: MBL fold metallo-hydrolase [Rhodobacterales bacterium]|nr:MBL fold metallo-hydrolase [Rhodobacterales bacterium]
MTKAIVLEPGLRCILAQNPSPLTGAGTNTYLLGRTELAVIDPGPDLDGHLEAILAATAGQTITQIIVTHAHLDHSALAPRLARKTGARILAFGGATAGMSPQMRALGKDVPARGEGLDIGFTPDGLVADGARILGKDCELEVLHTPGHLGGHLCLALGDTLFSGDHVMGWATTIVSPPEGDMGDYMASLRRLAGGSWRQLLPGHGPPVADAAARIAELLAHRQKREAQVLAALESGPSTPATLTSRVYIDTPAHLWPAAERNVLAHLLDLEARNLVAAEEGPKPAARFHRC